MRTPEFGVDTPLVVDATGVGDAIVDLLRSCWNKANSPWSAN
ncbi:MAG: hypothetical protein ACKV22_17355 [Bryobacteraceae bacterium]